MWHILFAQGCAVTHGTLSIDTSYSVHKDALLTQGTLSIYTSSALLRESPKLSKGSK